MKAPCTRCIGPGFCIRSAMVVKHLYSLVSGGFYLGITNVKMQHFGYLVTTA